MRSQQIFSELLQERWAEQGDRDLLAIFSTKMICLVNILNSVRRKKGKGGREVEVEGAGSDARNTYTCPFRKNDGFLFSVYKHAFIFVYQISSN